MLLGACTACPTLRKELEETRSKLSALVKAKAASLPVDCNVCPALLVDLDELRAGKTKVEEENTHLREILSWVSVREPQLGMMVE